MGRKRLKSDMMVAEAAAQEETRLGFILDLPEKKKGWSLDKARTAVKLLQKQATTKEIAKAVGLSDFGVTQFVKELRKAAEKGYTLEAYFKAGRPLHPAKAKVI